MNVNNETSVGWFTSGSSYAKWLFFFLSSFFLLHLFTKMWFILRVLPTVSSHHVTESSSESSSESLIGPRFAKLFRSSGGFLTHRCLNLCCSLKTGHIIISELSFKAYHFITLRLFYPSLVYHPQKHELGWDLMSRHFFSVRVETSERLFERTRKGTLSLFCGFRWFVCRSVVCRSTVWPCGIMRADQRMLHFSHFILSRCGGR